MGAAGLLLAGCGDGGGSGTTEAQTDPQVQTERPERPEENLKSVEITLNGRPGPENIGVLTASHLGYFEDVGLDVHIHTPVSPTMPVKYVADRSVDLSITQQPQLVLAKEKGVPIVAIRSVLPQPTATMIWLEKSGVSGLSDLKGKTIAIQGIPFQKELLQIVLAQVGLTLADVKVERAEYQLVPALASGRADAIFGGSWNVEGVELDSRGLEPVVARMEDLEIPAFEELVLIARRDRLAKDPKSIRDFLAAMARGTAAALDDPEVAIGALEGRAGETSPVALRPRLEATLPLLSRSGRMSPDRANRLVAWMGEQGLVQQQLPAAALLTNRYWKPRS